MGRFVLSLVAIAACGSPQRSGETARGGPFAAAEAPPLDPCRGADLSLGEAATACRSDLAMADPPPPAMVEIAIEPTPVRSGAVDHVHVVFRNVSGAPIDLFVPGTLRFDTSIWNGTQRVDERWEIASLLLGMVACRDGADCRPVQVHLDPGGRIVATIDVDVRTTIVRAGAVAGTLERSDGGPIPPGLYQIRVTLPWSDPVPGSATSARTPRTLEAPLTVAPPP
jgi:hypothetical protein